MEAVVKWKFRTVKPGKKHHTIDGYINYVEKQVEERRNNSGVFTVNEKAVIGLNDKIDINEDDFHHSVYLNYINERKGTSGCFSDHGKDVEKLIDQLKEHEGAVWIPIVSLKEEDAHRYGLENEASWMEKARELAEAYRKELGIASRNYKWIAAFHSKSEAEQNPDTDAGCQPHLHFMIWEETPLRSKYALKHEQIDHIRQMTNSILSREYMEQYYQERNRLKDEILSSSNLNILDYAEEVKRLAADINVLMGGHGKLTVGELEKRSNVSCQLMEKMTKNASLSPSEEYYQQILGIYTPENAKRRMNNYLSVLNRLNELSGKVMNTDLVQQWMEISNEMRASQHDPEKSTFLDYSALQRTVMNSILNEVKTISKDNAYIKDGFRGMLLDRVENGSFRKGLTTEQIQDDLKVITSLCKTAQISKEDALQAQKTLLERSGRDEFMQFLQQLVEEYYKMLQMGFDVTSHDFWQAMKDLRMPVSYPESQIISYKTNNYGIVNNTVIDPVVSNIMLVNNSSIMSGKDGRSIMNIGAADLAFIPKTLEEYETKYTSLLDALSSYGQQSSEEKDMLELY